MSSVFPGRYGRFAVDGIYSGGPTLVTASNAETQPWLQIDLIQTCNIVGVLFCARTDGYAGECKSFSDIHFGCSAV